MSLGLVGAYTAAAPLDTLEELLATQAAQKEAAFKKQQELAKTALETRRVGVEEGGLGIQKAKFGAEQDKAKADDAEFQQTLALAPEWLKPALRLRRQGLTTSLQPEDMTMSPEQQHTQKVGDAATVAAASAKAKEQEAQTAFGRQLQLHGAPTYKDLHPDSVLGVLGGSVPMNVTGDDALKGLDPDIQRTVKGIANYEVNLPSGMALSKPYWQKVLGVVKAYDPSFDATQYANRQKMRTDFNSGKAADNIRSLNTVVGHIDRLQSVADELGNTSIPWLNTAKNFLATKTGSATPNNFDTVRDAVSNELTKVFRGTGGAEADIQSWKNRISSAQSPDQLHGFVKEAIGLMDSRLSAIKSQWEKGMGKPADFSILTPESEATLNKLRSGGSSSASAESLPPASHFSGSAPGNYHVTSPSGQDVIVHWDGSKVTKGGG